MSSTPPNVGYSAIPPIPPVLGTAVPADAGVWRAGQSSAPRLDPAKSQQSRGLLEQALAVLTRKNSVRDWRACDRIPLNQLLTLVPLSRSGEPLRDQATVVAGKNISSGGISIFHPHALPDRQVLLSLELPTLDWLTLRVDLSWCRFTSLHWYESGGRILEVLPGQNQSAAWLESA